MDAQRLSRAKEPFLALRERRPGQRRDRLAAACGEDDDLSLEIRFAPSPVLDVSSIDPLFEFDANLWLERGFAVAPDGRLRMVRGRGEAGGLTGRIRVVAGWTREQGLDSRRPNQGETG